MVIDPRQRTVGIGFFQNGRLIDCHMKTFKSDGTVVTRARHRIIPYLIQLLDLYNPHGVLVPNPSSGIGLRGRGRAARLAIEAFVNAARERGMAVHKIGREDIRQWLMPNGERIKNADEANREVARRFPELSAILPAPRRFWEPQPYFTPLFNVAAMYIAWVRKLSNTPRA